MMYTLAIGFINGYSFKRCLDAENEWHQGTDTVAAAVEQTNLAGILFSQLRCSSLHWTWAPLKSIHSVFSANPTIISLSDLVPSVLGLGITTISKEQHPHIHYMGHSLLYGLGTCIKIAFMAVVLGTLINYPVLVVTTSLGYLCAKCVIDSTQIPYNIRKTIAKVMRTFSLIVLIIWAPSPINKVCNAVELGALILSAFSCKSILKGCFGEFSVEVKEDVSDVSLETIGQVSTAVNARHLKHSLFQVTLDQINPEQVKQTIDELRVAVKSIDFEPYKATIQENLTEDDHFNSSIWTPGKKDGVEIAFMKEGVLIFLDRLENAYASMVSSYPGKVSLSTRSLVIRKSCINSLPTGQKKHLAYLINWVQEVVQNTRDMENKQKAEEQKALFLVYMGIHGANYCLSRLHQLPDYMQGFSQVEKQPELKQAQVENPQLKKALYSLLQEKQHGVINDYKRFYLEHARLFKNKRFLAIAEQVEGRDTPHEFNRFLYLFGLPLGLNIDVALADRTLNPMTLTLERYAYVVLFRFWNRKFHQEDYTEDKMIAWVRTAINNGRINSNNMVEWLATQPGYASNMITNEEGELSNEVIRYFLLVHGVLGIKKD